MTGMDVLRRCRAYDTDMERLRLRLACARDAATRITRSMDTTGHGGGEDKMAAYAAAIDAIETALAAREAQHAQDVALAAELVTQIDPVQGRVMYLRLVCGHTVRQTAAEMHASESSVRGAYRRGRDALTAITVW